MLGHGIVPADIIPTGEGPRNTHRVWRGRVRRGSGIPQRYKGSMIIISVLGLFRGTISPAWYLYMKDIQSGSFLSCSSGTIPPLVNKKPLFLPWRPGRSYPSGGRRFVPPGAKIKGLLFCFLEHICDKIHSYKLSSPSHPSVADLPYGLQTSSPLHPHR